MKVVSPTQSHAADVDLPAGGHGECFTADCLGRSPWMPYVHLAAGHQSVSRGGTYLSP